MPKDKEDLQSALQRLEKIADDLNKKEIDVEAALEKFKEGVVLIKLCRSQLQKAENEFKKLKSELETEDGSEESGEKENGEERPVSPEDLPF